MADLCTLETVAVTKPTERVSLRVSLILADLIIALIFSTTEVDLRDQSGVDGGDLCAT